MFLHHDDSLPSGPSLRQQRQSADCPQRHELVLLTLTIPLWTFITLYLLLVLVHYLRKIQYFSLYDKCTSKNAHFRYDFHLVVGKHSTNYNRTDSALVVDLLDNQLISTMTVQVPGATIFNDNQPFMYRHSRADLRCVSFSIYRRHPMKDVKCIRIAHGCANPDSRLFVHGLNLVDVTNGENRFFPITSIVKYRATQWALTTSFEPKNEQNFSRIGCACYDPFGTSYWPTYMELLIVIFYLWATVLCFGSLISVDAIVNSVTLHALTVSFIAGSSAIVLAFIYLRYIKRHIVDTHYDSSLWCILSHLFLSIVIGLSLVFWALALRQVHACGTASVAWTKSSMGSASALTLILIVVFVVVQRRRASSDVIALDGLENNLIKTNSRNNIEFVKEATGLSSCNPFRTQPVPQTVLPMTVRKTTKSAKPNTGSGSRKQDEHRKGSQDRATKGTGKQKGQNKNSDNNETLDNAFDSDKSKYIKTKNRNSISQYV